MRGTKEQVPPDMMANEPGYSARANRKWRARGRLEGILPPLGRSCSPTRTCNGASPLPGGRRRPRPRLGTSQDLAWGTPPRRGRAMGNGFRYGGVHSRLVAALPGLRDPSGTIGLTASLSSQRPRSRGRAGFAKERRVADGLGSWAAFPRATPSPRATRSRELWGGDVHQGGLGEQGGARSPP